MDTNYNSSSLFSFTFVSTFRNVCVSNATSHKSTEFWRQCIGVCVRVWTRVHTLYMGIARIDTHIERHESVLCVKYVRCKSSGVFLSHTTNKSIYQQHEVCTQKTNSAKIDSKHWNRVAASAEFSIIFGSERSWNIFIWNIDNDNKWAFFCNFSDNTWPYLLFVTTWKIKIVTYLFSMDFEFWIHIWFY